MFIEADSIPRSREEGKKRSPEEIRGILAKAAGGKSLEPGEAAAEEVRAAGLATLVLQAGEDPWFTPGRITDLGERVKKRTGLTITLSPGEQAPRSFAT